MKIIHYALVLICFGSGSFFMEGDTPKFFAIERVDDSTKIIAYGGFLDENGRDFNFIIEKPDEIKKFISEIKYGEKVFNVFSENSIEVHLIQDYKNITSLNIIPQYKRVFANDGYSYKFDLNQLNAWREKYHQLKYFYKGMNFKTKDEFDKFLVSQKQNPDFLYCTRPAFRYEGSFDIQFPKTKKFHNPQAIMDYIEPMIAKIEQDKEKYSLSYVLDERNSDDSKFVITISTYKKMFETLKIDDYKNTNWVLNVENAIFYYRK